MKIYHYKSEITKKDTLKGFLDKAMEVIIILLLCFIAFSTILYAASNRADHRIEQNKK